MGIYIQLTYADQCFNFSAGCPDTPRYRRAAQRKAAIIEEDIEKDHLDSTLVKYFWWVSDP